MSPHLAHMLRRNRGGQNLYPDDGEHDWECYEQDVLKSGKVKDMGRMYLKLDVNWRSSQEYAVLVEGWRGIEQESEKIPGEIAKTAMAQ